VNVQQFLNELLEYLDKWQKSVNERTGFSDNEKRKMTLSNETETGIRIISRCKDQ